MPAKKPVSPADEPPAAPAAAAAPPAAVAGAETPPEPKMLFYVVSFFVPIAGIILGAIYLGKPDKPNKEFGKNCLVAALANFALGIMAFCCFMSLYVSFIVVYIVIIIAVLGAAAGGAMHNAGGALGHLVGAAWAALRLFF